METLMVPLMGFALIKQLIALGSVQNILEYRRSFFFFELKMGAEIFQIREFNRAKLLLKRIFLDIFLLQGNKVKPSFQRFRKSEHIH